MTGFKVDLNAALAQLGSDKAALQETVDALHAAGVGGVSLTGDDQSARVAVDATALAASLNSFSDAATLAAAVEGALDGLTERMAAAASARAA